MQGNTDNLIGRTLGTCTLQKLIGRGGMGAVYLAQQERPSRKVAVKILRSDLGNLDQVETQEFLARFRREANVIARLEHMNIMPLYEYGEEDGLAYLVMPYLSGGSLSALLQSEGPLPLPQVMTYMDQAASALDYAHAQGVIHRDLKPANFLLHADGRLILTDFGIARLIEDTTPGMTLTQTGMLLGTPDYMAPEMASGDPVDYRVDIYELGVVLFTLLSGHVPFSGAPLTVLTKHLSEPLPALHALQAEIPAAVDAVIQKATAKQREMRYSSVHDMSQALALHAALTAPRDQPPLVLPAYQQETVRVLPPSPPPQPQVYATPIQNNAAPPRYPTAPSNTETPYYPYATRGPIQPPTRNEPRRSPTGWIILSGLLVILLLFGGVFAAIRFEGNHSQTTGGPSTTPSATANQTPATATPVSTPTATATAKATATATATAAATPSVTATTAPATPLQTGTLLYQATAPGPTCDTGSATWHTYNTVSITCLTNKTQLTSTAQSLVLQGLFLTALPDGKDYPSDYVLEAELQQSSGSTGKFGLYFRNQPGSNQKGTYTLLIQPDGTWIVSVYTNDTGAEKELTKGTLSDMQATLKLAVVVKGGQFSFYANGKAFGSVSDTTYASGTAGIVVDQGASILARNFALYATA
ncbi:serine/threonine-protein kinase [Dictyobacter arantiisoli]|uniref:non-specific serine/threonine protein kinase n=1 Tax=Dictyobacter arantiisoli TaxID=2014874 RepID=A0A5A5TAL3_9CHLR|nr:serine/threonine-protein kinase [Dictyobacter arantiisoli]GCF08438.1 hypothetical protein KDI_20020 [Dictyobacter arantiisoli]